MTPEDSRSVDYYTSVVINRVSYAQALYSSTLTQKSTIVLKKCERKNKKKALTESCTRQPDSIQTSHCTTITYVQDIPCSCLNLPRRRYLGAGTAPAATAAANGAADEAALPVVTVVVVVVVVVVVLLAALLVTETTVDGTAPSVLSVVTPVIKRSSETASAPSGTVPLGAFGSVVTSWNSVRLKIGTRTITHVTDEARTEDLRIHHHFP